MKNFEIKIYQLDGSFKKTLLGTELINDFSFTSQINGGQGEAIFELNKNFGSTEYSIGDFVKVFCYTDVYPNGILLYSGMINTINRLINEGIQTVSYSCLGLSTLLNFLYFYSGSYTFNKNQDPADTIKNIIDYFNTKYSGNWFNYGSNIINYGSNISIDFDYTKCYDSINNIKNSTNYRWYIGPDGEVYFKSVPGTITHTFTCEKDINIIDLEEIGENICNKYILEWKSGILSPVEDLTSQGLYGIRELKENKTDIADLSSATIYANNFINKNKYFTKKTVVNINNSYNIESIKPGDTIKILNIDYAITNLQISKISYNPDNIKLELEKIDNIGKEIFNI